MVGPRTWRILGVLASAASGAVAALCMEVDGMAAPHTVMAALAYLALATKAFGNSKAEGPDAGCRGGTGC